MTFVMADDAHGTGGPPSSARAAAIRERTAAARDTGGPRRAGTGYNYNYTM
ncbi:hypothetical protein [Sanguibacter sp. Z1732]|uniref:hypothetical protein n=1 Tax=Sanguibacter sp. Z1732 TaxID=3435412 RepID=UPI003D9CA351